MKKQIESIVEKTGFKNYKWIDTEDIFVAQWVRVKCMFGCSDYGLGACPPNTPEVSECDRFFREYETALIISLSKYADKNAYPGEWSDEMTQKLLQLEREIFLMGYPKAFLLNQTCCERCNDCAGNRHDCIDKKNARPSPEAFAVDVYQTVQKAGLNIQVVADNPSEMNRIALLMIK